MRGLPIPFRRGAAHRRGTARMFCWPVRSLIFSPSDYSMSPSLLASARSCHHKGPNHKARGETAEPLLFCGALTGCCPRRLVGMAEDIMELKENAEHGSEEHSLAPVTLTMAILAVLVASVTLLGHRAHTEEVLLQTRAADQWAYYQAKEIRRRNYELFLDEMSVFSLQNAGQASAIKEKYAKEVERYKDELKDIQAEAKKAEDEVKVQEARADRYDLGEVLLEAALVICSITLLTRKRMFWYMGIVLALAGIAITVLGLMIH